MAGQRQSVIAHTVALVSESIVQDPATDLWIIPAALMDGAGRRIGAFYGDKVAWNPLALLTQRPAQLLLGNVFDVFSVTRRALLLHSGSPVWDETLPYFEDWDLWIRLVYGQHARLGMLPRETGGYRVRPGSLSHQFDDADPQYHQTWITIFAKILRDYPEFPAPVRQAVAAAMIERSAEWIQSHHPPSPRRPAGVVTRIGADD